MRDSNSSFFSEVAEFLRHYCRETSNALQVGRLVRLATSIVCDRLWGRLHAAAREQETSVECLSTSIVAGLFTENGSHSPLAKALENVLSSNDAVLFMRFRNVIVRAASQELFHRWRENDPLSARLWRNLHRVIRRDERIVAFPVDNPEWLSLTDVTDLQAEFLPVHHDEIIRIISSQKPDYGSLTDLIVAVLSAVVAAPSYQNTIKIDLLFSALRETSREIKARQLADEIPHNCSNPVLSIAIDQATEQVVKNANAKLGRYQATGKLSPAVVEVFRRALSDLIADCADGGPAQCYYEYLHKHKPDLTLEVYRRTLRTRFEYLAELVRNDFIEEMRRRYV